MSPSSFTHRENGRLLTDFTTWRQIYLFFALLDAKGIIQFLRKSFGDLWLGVYDMNCIIENHISEKKNHLLIFLLHLPQARVMIILGMGLVRVVRITTDWTHFMNV